MAGKLETEIQKATGIKPGSNRQTYLNKLANTVEAYDNKEWDKLSTPAQNWGNKAIKAQLAKEPLPDFEDDEEKEAKPPPLASCRSSRAAEEDDTKSDDKPSSRRRPRASDPDEDEEAKEEEPKEEKRSSRGRNRDPEDEPKAEKTSSRRSSRDDDKDAEEDKPAPRSRASKDSDEKTKDDRKSTRSNRSDDEKDTKRGKDKAREEKEEKPASTRRRGTEVGGKIEGVKVDIKRAIITEPDISSDALFQKLSKGTTPMSKTTICSIRAEFRHSLRVLQQEGCLKGLRI